MMESLLINVCWPGILILFFTIKTLLQCGKLKKGCQAETPSNHSNPEADPKHAKRRSDSEQQAPTKTPPSTSSDGSTCELQAPPFDPCEDAGLESLSRHKSNAFWPILVLQKRSMRCKNYQQQTKGVKIEHPDKLSVGASTEREAKDKPAAFQEKYKDKHVTFKKTCPVYIVYGFDECRGALEYDEDTMDDSSEKRGEALEKRVDELVASKKSTPSATSPSRPKSFH